MSDATMEAGTAGEGGPAAIITKNRTREWAVALLVYALLFLFMWEYHRWRAKPFSAFSANKAVAIAATLLFCLSVALGPIHRLTGRLRGFLRLRRAFGLTGATFMCVHLVLSLFFVEKFTLDYYLDHWPSWIFGAFALAGFLYLWRLSYTGVLRRIGRDRWRTIFAWAWVLLPLVVVHILFLGKAPNWLAWCRTINHPVPPGTTVPTFFVCLTLLLRLADRLFRGRRGAEG